MENINSKYTLSNRFYVIVGAVILIVTLFIARLFYLQIIDNDYKAWADSNAFLKKTLYPSRGVIYDRNGKLLVYNQPAYDVMLIMREIQPFDTIDFCSTLNITKEQLIQRMQEIKNRKLNPGYSSYTPQVFMTHLTSTEYGIFQEKLYKFPGFYIQNRTVREYGFPNAAHVLGNIGKVNRKDMERDPYYTSEDYSGRSGVERSYENLLRGEKGVEILLRDVHGRIKGKYEDGKYDKTPVAGRNIKLSIDQELQAYGEKLMANKLGGIVMIEPSTGEVLCMVSAPTFDPSILVGKDRGKNHALLEKDGRKPLLDRTIMAYYPPGSTFKPAQALVFLQEGIITPQTLYTCQHGYPLLRGKPACHSHASPLNLIAALATSCNAYFCWGLHDMLDNRRRYPSVQEAFETWKDHIVSMGYGFKLGIDLPGERRGYIPNSKVYDTMHKKHWNSSSIISTAIGQGEIVTTPLQICNLAATIANRGYFITPHVVREIQDTTLQAEYIQKRRTTIDIPYYTPIAEGMRDAVQVGTCRDANIPDILVCGKTGTAQNPHGKDHSIFMGFAPYENSKVAIAVFVENAGFGASVAVPIGRLMIEKYLKGEITESSQYLEEKILKTVIEPDHVR